MDSVQWVAAASHVLGGAGTPMHISQLKQLILTQNLVPAGNTSTLEASLADEMLNVGSNLKTLPSHPGYIVLMPTQSQQQQQSDSAVIKTEPLPRTLTVNGSSATVNRFEKKYRHLKKLAKQMMFVLRMIKTCRSRPKRSTCLKKIRSKVNAAVCDEVVRMEERVTQAKEERQYLVNHVLQQQVMSTMLGQMAGKHAAASTTMASPGKGGSGGSSGPRMASHSVAQLLGEAEKRSKKKSGSATAAGGGVKRKAGVLNSTDDISKLKTTKKSKTSSKRIVQSIPLDDTGRPILPIELGSLVVYCLGEIVSDRPGFHTAEYIYPVGFCSTRTYTSARDGQTECLYTCKIEDGGLGPQFAISPEDARDQSFAGTTASECHRKLMEAVLTNRSAESSTVENKGPEFFGFSHPTIQNLIQSCPGARKCTSYEWQKFEVIKESTERPAEMHTAPLENRVLPVDCHATPMDTSTPTTETHTQLEDTTLIDCEAIQKDITNPQATATPLRDGEAASSSSVQAASLRSLLTSGPLVQTPPTT